MVVGSVSMPSVDHDVHVGDRDRARAGVKSRSAKKSVTFCRAVHVLAEREHPEALALARRQRVERRHLDHARPAPGRPEIDQQRPAAEVGEPRRPAVRILEGDVGRRRPGMASGRAGRSDRSRPTRHRSRPRHWRRLPLRLAARRPFAYRIRPARGRGRGRGERRSRAARIRTPTRCGAGASPRDPRR